MRGVDAALFAAFSALQLGVEIKLLYKELIEIKNAESGAVERLELVHWREKHYVLGDIPKVNTRRHVSTSRLLSLLGPERPVKYSMFYTTNLYIDFTTFR